MRSATPCWARWRWEILVSQGDRREAGRRPDISGKAAKRPNIINMRIGFGIDFHQMAEGRTFWLGGVPIPSARGAVGHSDADVLIHAVCDALLGALALGDIGQPGRPEVSGPKDRH